MTSHVPQAAASAMRWLAEKAHGDDHDDGSHGFGVHIEYSDLYDAILFFAAIYMSGQIAAFIKMPSLVGEIVCGILLGPPLAEFVPNPEAFVLLGEIGYVCFFVCVCSCHGGRVGRLVGWTRRPELQFDIISSPLIGLNLFLSLAIYLLHRQPHFVGD